MREHLVQLFQGPDYLVDRVVAYVQEGLDQGEAGLVIAVGERLEAIAGRLRPRDRVIARDAHALLDSFMRGGRPDRDLFREHVGGLLAQAADLGDGRVRAFGEMVAILWQRGQQEAALALEAEWDAVEGAEPHRLLCAYPMQSFASTEHAEGFAAVCLGHSGVFASEAGRTDDPERYKALLEQKALALETEASRRQQAEEELASAGRGRQDLMDEIVRRLRDPLTPIAAAADMLHRSLGQEEQQRLVETIGRQTTELAHIIDGLIPSQRPVEVSPPTSDSGASAKVLVVDDNDDIRDTLSMLLVAYGHQVTTAADGQAALARLADIPDIVLLDLGLPEMDGFEVARQIRRQANPPVLVALSGNVVLGTEDPRLADFDHRLGKPPDVDRLMAIVAAAVRRDSHPAHAARVPAKR